MAAFLVYILKSALILALMVSLFMLFMSRETFHRINRLIMLGIAVLALVLPAVNIGIESPFQGVADAVKSYFAAEEPMVGEDIGYVQGAMSGIDEFSMEPVLLPEHDVDSPAVEKSFDWLLFATAIYIMGVAVLAVRQFVMYFQVLRLIARSRVADASLYGCKGIRLRVHSGKEKPFSWFRWVVVSEEDLNDGGREILIHETAHVHAGHSWDIVLADAVIILQWFNPLAWIMKNCLKDIHEFEADEAVIDSGVNARQYQLLIIKKAVGARLYSIANSFNHSLTKKRITMMCKSKSKKWRCAKALYIVPVAAIAALSFSTVETVNATESGMLLKGSEFASDSERKVIENCVSYDECTVKPKFPGGDAAYSKWLGGFNEPEGIKAEGVYYEYDLYFVVTKEGNIANYFVGAAGEGSMSHETHDNLSNELMRLRGQLPDGWTPGEVDGKPMDVLMTVKFTNAGNGTPDDDEKVYQVCEKAPEFPGGMNAMMHYLYNNIKYPAEAEAAGKGGRAAVQFIVKKDGSISDVQIVKSTGDESLDTEAVRAIASMPKWNPGTQGGKPVNVRFTIPVAFNVQKPVGAQSVKQPAASKLSGGKNVNMIKIGDGSAAADEDKVYQVCEKAPEFPGGMSELMKWFNTNIKYPMAARDINAQGKLIVTFVVMTDGSISNAKVVKCQISSDYSEVSRAGQIAKEIERKKSVNDAVKTDCKEIEQLIEERKKQLAVLEKDGVSENILNRRREELSKMASYLEEWKAEIVKLERELAQKEAALADSKGELDKVVVTAYKNKKGEALSTDEVMVLRAGAENALKAEAVRVVSSMPKWNPGTQGGKAVKVQFSMPVMFRLQ